MSLIVKIMYANRGNDAHPRHGHRIISGVQEVEFDEPLGDARAQVHLTFRRETEASPEETMTVPLAGNVYVMNDQGRTITTFEVAATVARG